MILKKIERQNKGKGRKDVTATYADIQTLHELSMDPFSWARLHRWDRLLLRYYLLVKYHYEAEAFERQKQKQEAEKTFRARLPAQMPRRR